MTIEKQLERGLDRWLRRQQLSTISVSLSQGEQAWHFSRGHLANDQPFFIASTTKLFTSALFLQLQATGHLSLDDPIEPYVASSIMKDLHTWQGKDYSHELTFRHLLSHTSGLTDYFQAHSRSKDALMQQILAGKDQAWNDKKAISWSKSLGPQFQPGHKRKAHYSDTNFQLLGHILESLFQQDLSLILEEKIIKPLGLQQTYLYQGLHDQTPVSLQYKGTPLHIPRAMSSFRADGGIVSNATDLMHFLKAFFEGQLFPKSELPKLQDWRKIFFPLRYGIGIAKFSLPRIFSPFSPPLYWLGHSGVSGAFAFYCPQKDLYLTGSVNEIHPSRLPFTLLVKLTNIIPS